MLLFYWRSVPILSSMPHRHLYRIAEVSSWASFPANEIIVDKGALLSPLPRVAGWSVCALERAFATGKLRVCVCACVRVRACVRVD